MKFDTLEQKQLVLSALNAFNVPLGQASEVLKLCESIVKAEINKPEDKKKGK